MTSSGSWNSLLIRLGERCAEYGGGHTDAEDHIETCYTQLHKELQHSSAMDDIVALLLQCAEELPHKSPLYGTLVGLINLEDNEFGAKVVGEVHTRLQDALAAGNCNQIRILMRFLTVLTCSNVVASAALIDVFEMLVSSAATTVDEERGNPCWQPRADFYVTCILACLPWGGLDLTERVPEELERVLLGVDAYFRLRKRVLEPALLVFDVKEADQQSDYLEDLWQRIQALRDSGWKVDSAPRPHRVFEARLATAQSHDFGPLECPDTPRPISPQTDTSIGQQQHEAAEKFPPRMRRLHIFPASMTDEKISPVDRFIVEEYILDVLFYVNGCRKECAAYLGGLPVPFRYEYLLAETIFSQLLLLPKPPFKLIYYTIVMVDLCKALPGAFPPVLAAAVRALFARIGEMDVECFTRLTQWLAHHLSNFQFVWPWEEWEHVLDQPIWSPQRVFAEEVLEKEIRLSYWERVKESVQTVPRLARLLPPKSSVSFKYSADKQGKASEAEIALATELIGLVRGKKTARIVQVWAEEQILPAHGSKVAIELLVQTLLYVGSKSFTHMVTVLEKFGQVLHKLAPDVASQALVVEVVAAFWQNSHQMISIAVDRMMGYRIVSNLAIVKWVFTDYNVQRFHTSDHIWEVLRNAINKTNNRTTDLKKELAAAEKAAKEASVAADEAKTKCETAKSIHEQDEGNPEASAKLEWSQLMLKKKNEEASSSQEALETKEALLARAIREQEALFITIFQSFVLVLTERLSKPEATKDPQEGDDTEPKPMDVDVPPPTEGQEPTDVEAKNELSTTNGKVDTETEDLEEQQWLRCTLGWLRVIVRHYSNEVWTLIDKLDAEVFSGDLHPMIAEAINSVLRRNPNSMKVDPIVPT